MGARQCQHYADDTNRHYSTKTIFCQVLCLVMFWWKFGKNFLGSGMQMQMHTTPPLTINKHRIIFMACY